jgi:hypothetical protein
VRVRRPVEATGTGGAKWWSAGSRNLADLVASDRRRRSAWSLRAPSLRCLSYVSSCIVASVRAIVNPVSIGKQFKQSKLFVPQRRSGKWSIHKGGTE